MSGTSNQNPGISFRSPLTWIWLTVVVTIPVLSIFGRPLQHWIAANAGYTLVAWVIGLGLLAAVGLLFKYLIRESDTVPFYHLVWFLPLFLLFPLSLERVEERMHFLTFGTLGALSLLLFAPRTAILLCLAFSGGDELLQFYLPDRVGDWRDVGMNALASVSAAMFVGLWLKRSAQNQR